MSEEKLNNRFKRVHDASTGDCLLDHYLTFFCVMDIPKIAAAQRATYTDSIAEM